MSVTPPSSGGGFEESVRSVIPPSRFVREGSVSDGNRHHIAVAACGNRLRRRHASIHGEILRRSRSGTGHRIASSGDAPALGAGGVAIKLVGHIIARGPQTHAASTATDILAVVQRHVPGCTTGAGESDARGLIMVDVD